MLGENIKMIGKSMAEPYNRMGESKKQLLANTALVFISLAFSIFLLELSTRIYFSNFQVKNFLYDELALNNKGYPSQHDPLLGWTLKSNHKSQDNIWNTQVSTNQHGVRNNAQSNLINIGSPDIILSLGDSYTFGDEVSDHQTWPSILEEYSGIQVINGGVFGYGVDQSHLRMKELLKVYSPTIIIFSIISDDILRTEFSDRSDAKKPYYVMQNGNLAPNNTPISHPRNNSSHSETKKILGYSLFIHKFMMNSIFRIHWFQTRGFYGLNKVHDNGVKVSCALINESHEIAMKHNADFYLLIQYTGLMGTVELNRIDKFLDCIDDTRINVINLRTMLANIKNNNREIFQQLYNVDNSGSPNGHMTFLGNQLVSRSLLEYLGIKAIK